MHSDVRYTFPAKAWVVFRIDVPTKQDGWIDLYMVLDWPSRLLLGSCGTSSSLSFLEAQSLLEQSQNSEYQQGIPTEIVLSQGDPAEKSLRETAALLGMTLTLAPPVAIDELTYEIRQDMQQSGIGMPIMERTEQNPPPPMVPDSYEPCHCNSGKKYKFCCKIIFREIMEAMVAAEDGHFESALKWIHQARAAIGETAEIWCREAIVHFNAGQHEKAFECLNQSLELNPKHPRAHYLLGIEYKAKQDYPKAIQSYKAAIESYPPQDAFHLNEAWNNLGTAYYESGHIQKAKAAWEKALLYWPGDPMVLSNLQTFIYQR